MRKSETGISQKIGSLVSKGQTTKADSCADSAKMSKAKSKPCSLFPCISVNSEISQNFDFLFSNA